MSYMNWLFSCLHYDFEMWHGERIYVLAPICLITHNNLTDMLSGKFV